MMETEASRKAKCVEEGTAADLTHHQYVYTRPLNAGREPEGVKWSSRRRLEVHELIE